MTYRAFTAGRTANLRKESKFKPARALKASRASLLFGTALGCTIAIMAASPNQAWAADECGADVAGAVICTATSGVGNPYPGGIIYTGDAGEDITVAVIGGGPATAVDISTGVDGVNVAGSAGQNATVNAYDGAVINAGFDGIDVSANGGDVSIGSEATIYAGYAGITGYAFAGDVTVVNSGEIYTGGLTFNSDGIAATSIGGDVDITNTGDLYTFTNSIVAAGIVAYDFAGSIDIENDADIFVVNIYGFAYGIDAWGDNLGVTIDTSGDMYVGAYASATGIYASSLVDASVTAAGSISAYSYTANAYGMFVEAAGGATVDMTGDIYAATGNIFANSTGIDVYGYTGTNVTVVGDITSATGIYNTGIDASSANDVTIDVTGDITAGFSYLNSGNAAGILAYTDGGSVDITVEGDISTVGFYSSVGIDAVAIGGGDADVSVTGDVFGFSYTGDGTGVSALSNLGYATAEVTGDLTVLAYVDGEGVTANGYDGAEATLTGDMYVLGFSGYADGVSASSTTGDAAASFTGTGGVVAFDDANGVTSNAIQGDADSTMTGSLGVYSASGEAYGVRASTVFGYATATVDGSVEVDAFDDATGVLASTVFEDATVNITNGDVDVYSDDGSAYGLDAGTVYGAALVSGDSNVTVESDDNAYAVSASSVFGSATIDLTGDVSATSNNSAAYGATANSVFEDASASIDGYTYVYGFTDGTGVRSSTIYGLAYSYAGDTTVVANGDATGVSASSVFDDSTVVVNGDLDITSVNADATGAVASSIDGATSVTVTGNVVVEGDQYATGVLSTSITGSAFASVTGDVYVDALNEAGYGVYAASDDSSATVEVVGNIDVYAYQDAYGAYATGGTSGSVTVTGNITVVSANEDAYGAYATSDGSAYVGVDGAIDVDAQDDSYGVKANADDNDATVVVTGNISSSSADEDAYGVLAYTDDGVTSVNVTGDIYTYAYDSSTGVYAVSNDGTTDVTVVGDIEAHGSGNVYGIYADGDGDVTVDFTGVIDADSDAYDGGYDNVTGIYANSDNGDVDITVTGTINTDDGDFATGVFAQGYNVTVDGGFDVNVEDEVNYGAGILATADGGDITIDVGNVNVHATGDGYGGILAYGDYTTTITAVSVTTDADYAEGILVRGNNFFAPYIADVTVQNVTTSGDYANGVDVIAYTAFVDVTGTAATSGYESDAVHVYAGDAYVNVANATTSGDYAEGIDVTAIDVAQVTSSGTVSTTGYSSGGIFVSSQTGDASSSSVNVNTAGDFSDAVNVFGYDTATITATGTTSTLGDSSDALDAYSVNGLASVTNSGPVSTAGNFSSGIEAGSAYGDVYVDNSGEVTTTGDYSAGILAYTYSALGTGDVEVQNDADITTSGVYSYGIKAYSYNGIATVDSTGHIETSGDYATGIYAYGFAGVNIYNGPDTVVTSGYSAVGILGFSLSDYVLINSGTVNTSGDFSTGIAGISFGSDATDYVTINSTLVNTSGNNADGIYAYAFGGDITITSGTVGTLGDGSYGINAYAFFGNTSVDSGTVTTDGSGSVGIYAYAYGSTYVESDDVTTLGDFSSGIIALGYNGPVEVDSGDVDTAGYYSYGIAAASLFGDVTVYADTTTTTGDASIGIFANSVYGDVYVNFGSVDTHGDAPYLGSVYVAPYDLYYYGQASIGIDAESNFGGVRVVGGDVSTYGDGAIGIVASGFGQTFVNVDDVYTGGDALLDYGVGGNVYYYRGAVGILASVTGGDVTVYADSVETHGDYAAGIVAQGVAYYDSVSTTFSGDTLVGVNFVNTFGDHSEGIVATNSGGNTTVNSFSVYTGGDYSDGIVAAASGYYDSAGLQVIYGDVEVNSTFVTTRGFNSYGINATAAAGDVDVNSYSVFTYGDFSTGIYAATFHYYDSTVGAERNIIGDVDVDSTRVYTFGDFSAGIVTYSEGGNISVTSNQVVTNGDFSDGIIANAAYYLDPVLLTYYSGDVYISATSTTTFGDFSDGIDAYAAGGDVLIRASLTRAYGDGSDAIYAATGGLDASNSDNVAVYTYSQIYAFDGVGIHVNSAGFSDIYVEGGQVYGYDWAIQSNSTLGTYIFNAGIVYGGEGRAIDVDGASAFIQNNGDLYGFVDLTDNADHIEQDGYWSAYGTSSFGLGSDDVDNDGTLAFSRYTGAAATTFFTGLEFFDNAGLITGYDNQVNDVLSMVGTSFTGTGASEFEFDVQLGGPGSAADRLIIGSAQGSTLLTPNDLLAGSPGALNFGGILVVDSANAAEVGNEFHMDNVDKGFVEYSLFFDAANDNWLIVGLPDDEVFELLGAMSSGQDFWKRSGDAISARWQELRDASGDSMASAGPGGSGRSEGWELWMQAHGGDESFENFESFAINGFTFAENLTADSDWRGFQFGFDNLQGNTLWGLTMGFTQQETKFDFDGNSFDTEGWNIGGYFGWASGGFFANALLKGDFYEQDANFHTLPSIFSFDGVTWGAQGELGFRWGGDGFYLEPLAALAWTTTQLDSVSTSGADIDFDDAESLRGKIGARIGGTWGSGDVIVTPYIGAYYVDEWQGDNQLTFTTGPTSITFSEEGRGSYGLVDFGMTFQTFYGLEGFVKGEWNFGGDADGGAARLGARWRW